MKALLLDGSARDDLETTLAADALAAGLEPRGYEIERRRMAELDVHPCTGCFGCWVRTPGECVIDDDARELAAAVIAADVFALATPVRFGTYASLAKSALDRLIPLVLPYFRMFDGEVHHPARYGRFPRYVVLGTSALQDDLDLFEEASAFAHLVSRNAINFHCPAHGSALVGPSQEAADAASRLLDDVLATKEVAA